MISHIIKGKLRCASILVVALTRYFPSIYVELADQYKDMDAVSDVPRRNLLAKHLREVVDILEQKASVNMSASLIFSYIFITG